MQCMQCEDVMKIGALEKGREESNVRNNGVLSELKASHQHDIRNKVINSPIQ